MSWNKTHSKSLEEKVKRLKEANSELREHIKLLQQPKSCEGCIDALFPLPKTCSNCERCKADLYRAKGAMR